MRLEHRRILITGGSSGIGLALARTLAANNEVVIAGRDVSKLKGAQADIPSVQTLRLDVTSEDDARAAIDWIEGHLGGLDVLINNAGVLKRHAWDSADAERSADEEIGVNLTGSVRMTRLALPLLRRSEEGAVVFLSSALALVSAPGLAVYAATKAATHSLARSLRAELANQVKVFDVLPPWVDTQLARDFGGHKLPPQLVAQQIVRGLTDDRFEIRIGRVKQLAPLSRIAPALADRIVARDTQLVSAAPPSPPSPAKRMARRQAG